MNLSFISACNTRAAGLLPEFRQLVCTRHPNSFDDDFYHFRFNNPYFGYVEVENDSCAPFYMLTNNDDLVAQHYFWYGRNGYERASVREWVTRAKSAKVVFDVGAHTGLFSLLASRSDLEEKQVVAFEPTARAHSRIFENLIINSLVSHVKVEQLAISDRAGTVCLMHYEDDYQIGTGASFLGTEKPFAVTRREACDTITLDSYVADSKLVPDLIKIDVEGAEIHALRGAEQLIANGRTTFLIEVLPSTVQEVVALLPGHTVMIIDDESNATIPFELAKVQHYTNLLVMPSEKRK